MIKSNNPHLAGGEKTFGRRPRMAFAFWEICFGSFGHKNVLKLFIHVTDL